MSKNFFGLFFSWMFFFLGMVFHAGCTGSAGTKKTLQMRVKSSPRPGVLAHIAGRDLTEIDLTGTQTFDFLALEKKRYEMLMAHVNQQAVEILIGAEAKKANQPLEEYLEKKVAVLDAKAVSHQEIDHFMKERNIPESSEVRGRVDAYLRAQKKKEKMDAYLARLTEKNPIEVYFKKPVMDLKFSLEGSPLLGKKEAPVKIVVASDFQCPYCARGAETIHQVKAKYGDQVAFIFKHYPLAFHPDARPVAESSQCAFAQGDAFFWKFQEEVFKNQATVFKNQKLDSTALDNIAKRIKLNLKQYQECVSSKKYAQAVQNDIDAIQKLGVSGTPMFFINGSPLSGSGSLELFSLEVEEALMEASAGKGALRTLQPHKVLKPSPKPGVLAKVGGQELTESDLIQTQRLDFLSLEKKRYDMLMANVNQYAVELLIGPEAKKANQSLDDYLDKKIAALDPKALPQEQDIQQFMKERGIPPEKTAEVKGRVEAYLVSQKKKEKIDAYLARLTEKNPIEVYFKKPVVDFDFGIESSPLLGKKEAPVKIVIASDFQCPYCSRAAETVNQVKAKYGDQVALVFKHYPLSFHPDARPVAEASLCAFEQGGPAFWKFHDETFKNQATVFKNQKLDSTALENVAKDTKLDLKQYGECVSSRKYAQAVQTDMDKIQKLGVTGTPMFFINGSPLSGAASFEMFSKEVEDALMESASSP